MLQEEHKARGEQRVMGFVLRLTKLKHSIRGEEEVQNTGDLKEIIVALECQRREQTGSTMSVEEQSWTLRKRVEEKYECR